MKRFYSNNIQSNIIFLENEEAYHCSKVLRCKENDSVEILNGTGILYNGTISNLQKHEVQIEINSILKQATENKNKLSIAICPTKNPSRLEWFVEKATEIGIVSIFPIVTDRTEKESIKLERLQHILISAAKQSGQLFLPSIYPIQKFSSFINTSFSFEQYFIAHCNEEEKLLKTAYQKNKNAILLIGPEGDFTKKEIDAAINKNYVPISLGNSILRVETAGVAACAQIQMINQ